MKRRAVLAGLPAAVLLGGCTDLLSDDEVTFEADTAVVPEDVQTETDYQEKSVEDQTITREFERVDRTVVVVNRVAEYSREVELGPVGGELARFTVVATPTVEVGPVGPLNPVEDMDNDEIAEMMQDEYDEVRNVEAVGEREATLLGETVTVTKYSAEARTQGGESVEVFVHIAQGENEEDFVLTVGVYPQDLEDVEDEESTIDRLIESVQHPAAGDGGSGGDGNETDDSSE